MTSHLWLGFVARIFSSPLRDEKIGRPSQDLLIWWTPEPSHEWLGYYHPRRAVFHRRTPFSRQSAEIVSFWSADAVGGVK
jgi:hypothetical protein